jgi:hypothetical protein
MVDSIRTVPLARVKQKPGRGLNVTWRRRHDIHGRF